MPPIVVYTKPFCPYCARAMHLLDRKGAKYEEIVASMDPEKRNEMIERSGGRTTYPQIFIGDRHIGGCEELHELDYAGELDGLLQ